MNKWLYGYANPIRYVDPTGMYSVDDLPIVLLDPRKLGFYAGDNVDLLPYLFYLNPNDFSFSSSVRYNANSILEESAISQIAKTLSNVIGQGGIPNLPGDENYRTRFIVRSLGINKFWERLIEVNGNTQNLFSAWFVTESINGKTMIAETFPLRSRENYYSRATVYFGSVTQGNANRLILQSDYVRFNFGFISNWGNITGICALSNYPFEIRIFDTGIQKSDSVFRVEFSTRQTGPKSVQTIGTVKLLTDPNPIGIFTMSGDYIGEDWKLRVLDNGHSSR